MTRNEVKRLLSDSAKTFITAVVGAMTTIYGRQTDTKTLVVKHLHTAKLLLPLRINIYIYVCMY